LAAFPQRKTAEFRFVNNREIPGGSLPMPNRQAFSLLLVFLILCKPTSAQHKQLTIDDIFDPQLRTNFTGFVPDITWLPNGREYLLASQSSSGNSALRVVRTDDGADRPLFDVSQMERALDELPGFSTAEASVIARDTSFEFNPTFSAVLFSAHDDLYYYELNRGRVRRLTSDQAPETDATFSPDGRLVAFIRNNDLLVVDVREGHERALTTNGSADRLNGRLDWVYE
jgi:dipeptidyl-peptidase-4